MEATETTTPAETPKETITETIKAPHKFSDAELLELGKQMLSARRNLQQIEGEFEAIKEDYKSKIKNAELSIDSFCRKMEDGFEMRDVRALITFHSPRHGWKTLANADTGALIKEEPMTPYDYERPLFNEEETVPQTEPEPEHFDATTGDGQHEASTPGGEDAGTTPIGEVLDNTAAKTDQPQVSIPDFESKDVGGLWKAFRKAASEAGWPKAAISVIVDQLKTATSVDDAKRILRPHVADPSA